MSPALAGRFFFFFNFIYLFIYLFMAGLVFVSVRGLSLVAASGGHSSSRCMGLSLLRSLLFKAQAPDTQAQQLWLTGVVAPWHVASSQTRARTRVPCIGRQILNHCATREGPGRRFLNHCATREVLGVFLSHSFLKFHSVHCMLVQLHTLDFEALDHSQLPN